MSGGADSPVLEIEALEYARGPGADDFRLELPALVLARGEFVALAGESGSGKSTLLGLIAGLARPSGVGRFRLLGEEIGPRLMSGDLEAIAQLRRRSIGFVLQHGGLLPFLSVADNIRISAPADRPAPMVADALAERLGIADKLGDMPGQLSVGQRQRVAIARAVMADPALILADEPTAALDPPNARATLELFRDIAAERGTAVLMATHAWGLIEAFGLPVLAHRTEEQPQGGAVASFRRVETGAAAPLAETGT